MYQFKEVSYNQGSILSMNQIPIHFASNAYSFKVSQTIITKTKIIIHHKQKPYLICIS